MTLQALWHTIREILLGKWYWLLLALTGIVMEGVALYYQYGLGDEPCQICIHIRIWVAAFTLLAVLMCVLPRSRLLNIGGHLLGLGIMAGLWERCRYLLDVENGLGDASCEFFLGFPDWFALDRWLPALFEVRNLCGPTPLMPGGISMAQYLMASAWILLLLSAVALGVNVARKSA
jgi:protein dithiol:quinone oxidoreductase